MMEDIKNKLSIINSYWNEYYFSKKLKEIKAMEDNGRKVINLGIGSPDLAPSEKTIHKLIVLSWELSSLILEINVSNLFSASAGVI